LVITGFALWRLGVFDKFWFWTVTYAREYEMEATLAGGLAKFRSTFPGVVGPNLLIWMIAAASLVMIWWKKEDRTRAAFVSAFLVFSFLAVCQVFTFANTISSSCCRRWPCWPELRFVPR
jgi:hypothetical protein